MGFVVTGVFFCIMAICPPVAGSDSGPVTIDGPIDVNIIGPDPINVTITNPTPDIEKIIYCNLDTDTHWIKICSFAFDTAGVASESIISETDTGVPCSEPAPVATDYEPVSKILCNADGEWTVTSFVNTSDITDVIGPVYFSPLGIPSPDPGDLETCAPSGDDCWQYGGVTKCYGSDEPIMCNGEPLTCPDGTVLMCGCTGECAVWQTNCATGETRWYDPINETVLTPEQIETITNCEPNQIDTQILEGCADIGGEIVDAVVGINGLDGMQLWGPVAKSTYGFTDCCPQ